MIFLCESMRIIRWHIAHVVFFISRLLRSIGDTNSWNPEQITILANLPTEQYYKLFKETRGSELRKLISASLQFGRISNAT